MSKYDKCYRVIFNSASNDFNDELDYTIATYHLNKNNTKMKWTGNERWFDIKDDVIYDRREAERELVKKCLGNYKKSNDLQQQLDQLKQQLVEKDKEIETLKQELEEINAGYDFTYEQSSEAIKELKQNQTQLAIQELEKLKASAGKWFGSWENSKYEGNIYDKLDVSNAYLQMSCEIDQQIKELKGEKDVKD